MQASRWMDAMMKMKCAKTILGRKSRYGQDSQAGRA
jgi:hypothetical protein